MLLDLRSHSVAYATGAGGLTEGERQNRDIVKFAVQTGRSPSRPAGSANTACRWRQNKTKNGPGPPGAEAQIPRMLHGEVRTGSIR
jgi:hypothetical protein